MENDRVEPNTETPQNEAKRSETKDAAFTCMEIRIRGETVKFLLDLGAPCQRFIFDWCQNGFLYEFPSVLAMDSVLYPGDTFLDVGAHIGFFTLIAAHMVGPRGRVVAFEPDPTNFSFLQRNIACNRLENVTLIKAAAGEKEGTVTLYENLDNDGGHALWPPGLHSANVRSRGSAKSFAVEQTTLDLTAERLGLMSIKAIKIDTEGAEVKVVSGAKRRLTDRATSLVICEHLLFALQAMGAGTADLLRPFYSAGYEGYISSNGVDFEELPIDREFQPTPEWMQGHRDRAENIFFVRKEKFSWPSVLRVSSKSSPRE
jgi:FkbM family methyltransferase